MVALNAGNPFVPFTADPAPPARPVKPHDTWDGLPAVQSGEYAYSIAIWRPRKGTNWIPSTPNDNPPALLGNLHAGLFDSRSFAAVAREAFDHNRAQLERSAQGKRVRSWAVVMFGVAGFLATMQSVKGGAA